MNANELARLILDQSWQLAVLAGVVLLLHRTIARNRPHLAHLLWGVVLIKAIVPPVVGSPVGLFSWLRFEKVVACISDHRLDSAPNQPSQPESRSDGTSAYQVQVTLSMPSAVSAQANTAAAEWGSHSITPFDPIRYHWLWYAVRIWIAGVVVTAGIRMVRIWRFMRFAKSCQLSTQDRSSLASIEGRLSKVAQRLTDELQLRGRVRLHVTPAGIGPLVYGLFYPTILLPLALVAEKRDQALRPLIAHELIHIKRGDLWWAGLQSLATILFWFHPLVWFASRMLTRESERCCDEQTVGLLKCSGAEYARALLDVLDLKHRLRVGPALPGVRPVDVTRSRLERIMKLGQGCCVRTPVWVWFAFGVCAMTSLPGGVWLSAQQTSPQQRNTQPKNAQPKNTQQQSDDEHGKASDQPATLAPILKSSSEGAERVLQAKEEPPRADLQARNAIVALPMGDLLAKWKTSHPDLSEQELKNSLFQFLSTTFHRPNVDASNWLGEKLVVRGSQAEITKFQGNVEQVRQHGFDKIQFRIEVINISQVKFASVGREMQVARLLEEDDLDLVPMMRDEAPEVQAATDQALYSSPPIPRRAFYKTLSQQECETLRESLIADQNTKVMSSPRITALNGQQYTATIFTQRPLVVDYQDHSDAKPVVANVETGLALFMKSFQVSKNDIEFAIACKWCWLDSVGSITLASHASLKDADQPEKMVNVPSVSQSLIGLRTKVESDQVIMLTSGVSMGDRDTIPIVLVTVVKNGEQGLFPDASIMGARDVRDNQGIGLSADKPVQVMGPIAKVGAAFGNLSVDEILIAYEKQILPQRSIGSLSSNGTWQVNHRKVREHVEPARFVPLIGTAEVHHFVYRCECNPLPIGLGVEADEFYVDHVFYRIVE